MPITNETRRKAILWGFVPLLALAAVLSLRFDVLLPSLTTWPTQRELARDLAAIAKHKIWPWTIDGYWQGELEKEIGGVSAGARLPGAEEEDTDVVDPDREPFTRHIVAVGDLHGDLPNARKVLKFAGVTDEKGDWSGDVDFFVQTGDIIDRGDDTILLFLWMEKLRIQASKAGGTVLSLLGNHEWMNALGDWRYVYPSELKTFGSIDSRQRMLTTGRIGRAWANNYTTAARLPLHPSIGPPNTPYPAAAHMGIHFQKDDEELDLDIFHPHHYQRHRHDSDVDHPMEHAALSFVHGGLAPTYPDLAPFPTKINEIGASLLAKLQNRPQPPPHPPAPYAGLPKDATAEETHLYGTNGPLWYRGWAQGDDEVVCAHVDEVLEKTGTRRMIMGHTPDFKNIKSRCDGKIIIIDTGISHAYGGVLSALSIRYTLKPIGETSEKKWKEREVVAAIYSDRVETITSTEREVVGDFDYLHQAFKAKVESTSLHAEE